MFRLALSIIFVIVFAVASTTSVMHGSDHADHHAEMTENDPPADAEKELADCCGTTNGMGSTPCFCDLAATSANLQVDPAGRAFVGVLYADCDFVNLTLAVPTGPPKV